MAGKYSPTVVGTDAFFREICIGDEIQDLDGRHYTVDKYGRCKPLDGGNTVPLSSVKEAALVSRYEGPPIDVTERRPDPQPEKKTVIMVPDPRPKKLPLIESPAPAKDPQPEKRMPGKKNKSGIVQITAITRTLGISRTRGLTDFLHQNGIETTFVPKRNKVCIKIEDRDRVTELARQWAEKEPQPEAQAPKPAAPPKEKPATTSKANCGDLPVSPILEAKGIDDDDIVKAVEEHGLWLRCLDECPGFSDTLLHNVLTRRGFYGTTNLDALPGFNPAETLVTDAVDKMLADELRSRGYAVTAIKHVEL